MPYLAVLMLAVIDAAGYSVIAPVTPSLASASGAGPAVMGCLVASFPVGMMTGFALAAPAIARGRYAPLLAGSLLLVAVGSLGFIVSNALGTWFAARTLMGVGSGGVWMGVTFATLERWPGQEYVCMSRVFAAYSVGGLVGPALGALGGIRAPFAGYLCLVALGLMGTAALRPARDRRSFLSDRAALRVPGFATACLAIAFVVLALGLVEGVLPLHFSSGLDQRAIGLLYAAIALISAASAAIAGRVRPRRLVLVASGLVVGGVLAAGSSSSVGVWLVALAVLGVGIGVGNTGAIGLLLDAVSPDRIVTAMIAWSQIGILGYLAGPLAGGVAAETLGYGALAIVPVAVGLPLVGRLRHASAAGATT